MISKTIKRFCKNYEKIENYEEAASSDEKWDCHHRLEIEGDIRSRKELQAAGLYYNRPPEELIFLTHGEHAKLHMKGNILSKETKKKMSEAKKGKHAGRKNYNWKGRVQCVETGEVYECAYDAQKELGIGNVGLVCQGKKKTAGGYHWKYID